MTSPELSVDMGATKPKYYPILDFVRFIAALLIIWIHIFPEGSTTESVGLGDSIPMLLTESFVYALIRSAVPVFFIISAFLLFHRIHHRPENKWKYVGSFCLRLLFLYLFWYVVALPITVRDIVSCASAGDTQNLIRYFVITVTKGAPRGFWFLVSLALSAMIVNLANGKKSFIAISVIAGILYAYGCLNSAYFGLLSLSDDPVSKALFATGNYLELSYGPLQALLFVVLGKIFALHGEFKIKWNIVWVVISFFLMAGELFLTLYLGWCLYVDAFLSLPIFVFFFFNLMIGVQIQSESFARVSKKLKKVGSFSYLFHLQFFYYLHWALDSLGHNIFREQIGLLVLPYFVCVALCFGLQTLFEYLSRYNYLRFLKYSY